MIGIMTIAVPKSPWSMIKTKTVKSSNFNIDEKRTKKIITLLNNFKVK